MHNRIYAIIRRETRELLRDPVYLGLAFIVPLALKLLFGYGLTMDVKNIPVLFYDLDRSSLSREYMNSFTNSEYFRNVGLAKDYKEIDHVIRSGKIRVVVVIPSDFSRRLHEGRPAQVQFLADGSFPMRAEVVKGYVAAINAQFNQGMVSRYLSLKGQTAAAVFPTSVEGRAWYNPSLESKNFIIPGLLVITLMFYPALLAALVVVREKESGTIYNLYCSPVRPWEVVAGKAIPYIGVAFINYILIFLMSVILFKVRFTGSFILLSVGALLYIACTIGIGLFISVISRTQIAAMLITFLGTMIPAFLFSGFMAPITSQDITGQIVSRFIPATYFMGMVKGIYLKGLGFGYYAWDLLTLTIYAAVVYSVAILSFRKKVG
ncbi:MAG TPA: ABC transporter permease [Proteobacteria bacterium]|nr:ABC transporter permease [Pseudomonadota bacterium]